MKKRLMLIVIIVTMCVIVGIGGILTFLNSDSVFKGNKKTGLFESGKLQLFLRNPPV